MPYRTGLPDDMNLAAMPVFRVIPILALLHLLLPRTSHAASSGKKDERLPLDVGVILDFGSFIGKEARVALEIAREDFEAVSRGYELKLHYQNSGGKPLRAVSSAEKLIKRKKVKAIIGLHTWKEAELVGEIGNRFQVPVISLARNPFGLTPPGILQMGSDPIEQMRCIAEVVRSYNRKRVSIIYEEDTYSDGNFFSLYLSKELDNVGSEIEDRLVLPQFTSLPNPDLAIKEKLGLLEGKVSPVFIILDLSSPMMMSHLLREAKEMGLFKGDSIWVLSETALNLLGSANSSLASSMEVAVGVAADLPRKKQQYLEFTREFRRKVNHKAGDFMPGMHALRAYDCLTMLIRAVNGVSSAETIPEFLIKRVLQTRFDGLSGRIEFKDGRISNPGKFELVSVGGGKKSNPKELKLWSPDLPSKSKACVQGLNRDAIGSINDGAPIRIGVPLPTPFNKFVKKVVDDSGRVRYDGFCIDVFHEILSRLSTIAFDDHNFDVHYGSYDDLVEKVHNQTYQAAVGDITILSGRSKLVDFTQPFMESGLSMIVLEHRDNKKTWIFVKPFTPTMWMASGGILILTMLTVWFIEYPSNPEYRCRRRDQFAYALWFTFSSLFFAHREKIYRNLTRVVLVVWFFMALILTQSYTASLTSMLTVQKLKPNEITMEWLKQRDANVGCDNSTFVCNYLEKVHNLSRNSMVAISNYTDISDQLKSGKIKAMFLENPYERAFFSRYCSGFAVTHLSDRFGGFGFVFQKGSPWTAVFSEAILDLSEAGKLKSMADVWFSPDCVVANATTLSSDSETQSLGLSGFWALYVVSAGTSTLCLLLSFFFPRMKGDGEGNVRAEEVRVNGYPQVQHEIHKHQEMELQRK